MLGAPKQEKCARGHVMSQHRKRHPNGDSYCSACKAIRYESFRKGQPKRVAAYSRNSRMRRWYGLTPEQIQALLTAQDNRCGLCGSRDWGIRGPSVDHDHATGIVRGMLCHRCNTGLGLFRDDEDLLEKAKLYLSKAGKSNKKQ